VQILITIFRLDLVVSGTLLYIQRKWHIENKNGKGILCLMLTFVDRVVETGLYNYCTSLSMKKHKLILLSLTRLMDITASTSITCNLPSISF
jgi:hypothetical protein